MSNEDPPDRPAGRDSAFEALLRDVARTPTVAAPKQPGDSFAAGRYRVERLLGQGGQKLVYLVRDTALQRDCALSLVPPGLVEPAQLERFQQEAQAMARFGAHANIVTIYDLGDEDGVPYVLCEYLDGGDLRAAMAGGERLSPSRALHIARDLCRALAFAHQRGIVHRDVTPANIWLLDDGTAKLGDFGLALVTGQSRLTAPGGVVGTAAYLAPEQALGQPVDGRADLYALGCVLYELFTGAPPFVGDSALAVVSQHLHAQPVPPDERDPGVGPKAASLVMRLLSKQPDDRPASSDELLAEIERLLATSPTALTTSGADFPIPDNERERLSALHALGILDSPPEPAYDELAELAAAICGCPSSYICFVDETRQWMKARVGFPAELAVAPREIGICQTTICQSDVLVCNDLAADPRFRALPPVSGPPRLRFYCGAPLVTARGHALGTLVVLDYEPRELSFEKVEAVRRLAHQVVTHLELMHTSIELQRTSRELERMRREAERSRRRADAAGDMLPEWLGDDAGVPRYHGSLTVGFAQIGALDALAASLSPAQLVATLDEIFSAFDDAAQRYRLDKIKTLGGTYVFAAGLGSSNRRAPLDACLAALEMQRAVERLNRGRVTRGLPPAEAQIGLHTGPAMTGLVGRWKASFDVWGPGASLAARLAAAAGAGRLLVSESTHERIKDFFECQPDSSVEVPSRGTLATFAVSAIAAALRQGSDGAPNARFHELASARFGAPAAALPRSGD